MDNVVVTVINLIIWLSSCTSAQQETIWYSPMSQAYNAVDTDWTVVANNFQFKENYYCPNSVETPYCWQVCGENPNNDGYIYRIISTEYYQDIKLQFNVRPTDTWEGNAYCQFYYNINNNGDSNWIPFYQHGDDWEVSSADITLNIATGNNIGVGIKISAFSSDDDCCNLNEIQLIGTPMTQTPTYQPTEQPTTPQPTTTQPTTSQPTTSQPTTTEPTTVQPTTAQPTTSQPTTAQPTTAPPTTSRPTTSQPTTSQPTTAQPTTSQPTTAPPTTPQPITSQPTTHKPTTTQPTTTEPTTAHPTTSQPTTAPPTTSQPTTSRPTTPQPITSQPTTIQPTTAQPTTHQPTTAQPTTTNPTNSVTTSQPTSSAPTSQSPTSQSPTTSAPSTTSPTHNTIILHPTLVVSLPTESSDYESSTSTHILDSNEGLGADYAAIPFTNSDTFIGILCGALFLLTLLCITIAIKRWKNTNNKLLDRYDEGKLVSKHHFQQHEIVMSCTPTNTTTNTFDANLSHGHVTVGMPNVDNIDLHETTTDDDDDDDDANLEYGEYGEFPRTLRNAATINTMVMDEIVNEMETTGQ